MSVRKDLRLVSFDGGGARGFSQLRIMGQIMHQLHYDEYPNEPDKVMLPCEQFDLMGGSGTGGLIAIMFARLRMTVDEASDAFFRIVEEVYEPNDITPLERTEKLKQCIEDIMERKGLPLDLKLMEKPQAGHCLCFVVASPRTNAANKVCLRSYPVRTQLPSTITVIDAIRATCAIQPTFAPVTSGSGYNKKEYIGAAGIGAANPVREVITEAHSLFGGGSNVASLLSLGIGHPGIISFPSDSGISLLRAMRGMMEDCEQRAQEVERHIGRVGLYFRFSIEQGMQNYHLGHDTDPSHVIAQTEGYLEDYRTAEKVGELVETFRTTNKSITLDQLEHVGGTGVSTKSTGTLETVLAAIESNQDDNILAKLKVADLECGPHSSECMEGTRRDILEKIDLWATDFDAPNILWLKGHPGVGKSAIAAKVVERLETAKRLGSRFFFQRQRAAVMTTNALWRTVAYDLARQHPTIRNHLLAALKADDSIVATVNVDKLFRQLVQEPLMESKEKPSGRLPIVVIDALDECGRLEGQHSELRRSLMRTLKSWAGLPSQFKLIVTSRGENDVERVFSKTSHHSIEILAGQTVEAQSTEDIKTFLTHELRQIAEGYDDKLPSEWPESGTVKSLADAAAGLFIWAVTVVNFIRHGEPRRRLKSILNQPQGLLKAVWKGGATDVMGSLYSQILTTSFHDLSEDEIIEFRSVVGTIILAKAPLSFSSLQQLLSLEASSVKHIFNGLQSVIESEGVLRFHHQSFVDFVIDSDRCPPKFQVELQQATKELTLCCLTTMTRELKFNICELETSCSLNTEIKDLEDRVQRMISGALQYSCVYWSSHLCSDLPAASAQRVVVLLDNFFMGERPIYWLEALSVMGKVPASITALRQIKASIKHFPDRYRHAVDDILRFVLAFLTPISTSTPHIYISALPFTPTTSVLWLNARNSFPNLLNVCRGRMESWPARPTEWLGHTSTINSIAFSPDGLQVVSASLDNTIRLWDLESGVAMGDPLNGHTAAVNSVAFSPDGLHVVSGSSDYTIRIWDAETGMVVGGPLEGHTNSVLSVAYSPDGRHIISGSSDRTIQIWDVEAGAAVGEPLRGHEGPVWSVACSPDGRHVASGSADQTIQIWDVETGVAVGEPLKGHTDEANSVIYSPDGRYVFSGSDDRTVRIWDARTGVAVGEPLRGHTQRVWAVGSSPDGRYIASGSGDYTIRIWDAGTGAVVGEPLRGHTNYVRYVKYCPNGQYVVSGSADTTIRIWDAESGLASGEPLRRHTGSVRSVARSPDGQRVVSGSEDKTIRIWDAETGAAVGEPLRGHEGTVWSVAYSPDGRRVVSGSADQTIRIWDVETGVAVGEPMMGNTNEVNSVAYSSDGRYIFSGSDDHTVRIWDAGTGVAVGEPLRGHTRRVWSVACSPDGRYIVSGSEDNNIRIWHVETGSAVGKPLEGHTDYVNYVTYSPDGRYIVSSSADRMIRIWDAETGATVGEPLRGHEGTVWSVAYSPDGRYVASGSADQTIRIWDVETGVAVGEPLKGHTSGLNSVIYSSDGRHIVSGSRDNTIRTWDARVGLEDNSRGIVSEPPPQSNQDRSEGHFISTRHTSLADFSDHAFNAEMIDSNGWVHDINGLLFWVPEDCRNGLTCEAILTIPNGGRERAVRLDFTRFQFGNSWTNVRGCPAGERGC